MSSIYSSMNSFLFCSFSPTPIAFLLSKPFAVTNLVHRRALNTEAAAQRIT